MEKILIVFDDIIADMLSKTTQKVVPELFIKSRKINAFLVFISQSYFDVQKNIRLNSANYFHMKIQNKREVQQIAINHLYLSCISFIDFAKLVENVTQNHIPFYIILYV